MCSLKAVVVFRLILRRPVAQTVSLPLTTGCPASLG